MTAIITKNGTGVPPSEALQKGELAVDLDGLKLYTSTNGTDVVEVSAAEAIEQNIELDIEDIGEGKINHDFWLKGIGRDNEEIPRPQFQYQAGEEYTTLLFNEGIFDYRFSVKDEDGNSVFEINRWEGEPVLSSKPIQAPDYLDADGNSIIGAGGGGGAWSSLDGYIQIADEPTGGYSVTWSYSDGEENYLWCYEVDCKEVGGEIGYFTEFGSDKVEIGTAPAGFSASKEKFLAKRSEKGIAVPMAEGDTPLVVHGKIQANDLVDADGNSLLGGGSDLPDITMDAYGTATTTITHDGQPMQVGVGHWVEEEQWGDYNYWLKKDFFEDHSGEDFMDPIYHIVGAGWTFSWMGESCGSVYADFEELYGEAITGETCVIGTAPSGRSAKRQKVLETRAKYTGFQVPFADDSGTDTPLIVYGKIQANDLVDAEGNSLLGGGEMPEVIDGGTY